jgi:hypothetical protein
MRQLEDLCSILVTAFQTAEKDINHGIINLPTDASLHYAFRQTFENISKSTEASLKISIDGNSSQKDMIHAKLKKQMVQKKCSASPDISEENTNDDTARPSKARRITRGAALSSSATADVFPQDFPLDAHCSSGPWLTSSFEGRKVESGRK